MSFNGFLKYSQSMAMNYYQDKKFDQAIPLFENIINYYPIKKGKYHAYLSECYYLGLNDEDKALEYFCNAETIIPDNNKVKELKRELIKNGLKIDCNN